MDLAPGYKSILTCNTIPPLTTWSSSLQNTSVMASSFSIAASLAGAASLLLSSSGVHAQVAAAQRALPDKAQIIDQKSFNVLEVVPPPLEFNASSVCHPEVTLLCVMNITEGGSESLTSFFVRYSSGRASRMNLSRRNHSTFTTRNSTTLSVATRH